MGQVRARAQRTIAASADTVRAAIADYSGTRVMLLTRHFTEYEVFEGGTGAGTRAHWKLAATKKRVRDCQIVVTEADGKLVESDESSSMVTTWTVVPEGDARSTVSIETTWNGASGIGGFFERAFAPAGLRRIYELMLVKLNGDLQGE